MAKEDLYDRNILVYFFSHFPKSVGWPGNKISPIAAMTINRAISQINFGHKKAKFNRKSRVKLWPSVPTFGVQTKLSSDHVSLREILKKIPILRLRTIAKKRKGKCLKTR
ncbi:hypothetical protein DINM_004485 [Dirofilaria immitis]|nr:hypothetical protein [Dirofilaria immitis]